MQFIEEDINKFSATVMFCGIPCI